MHNTHCPCKSGLAYANCCQPIHINHSAADTPEKLMRSRYSAHYLKLVDYVVATYHPDCNAEQQREQIAESVSLDWCHLDVISSAMSPQDSSVGFVEFRAQYIENDTLYSMQELSRFIFHDGLWFYRDGTFDDHVQLAPVKIKRNDQCPCQSGKKYKKCCG
ncbi:YchJ family metal-binding protein [Vibrio ulleungensis]|uniref:SEC-C domain-containing protein n=1 Tax=Vibrio ulleungensis TaxID=2807619 RepID=A0ABS2HK13_9VIBR|nr:YchJ family metal-binding protein [Vibrio ulleungensis]MBM7036862.1 SEC-C domain-containing protein [Vibrio ulleungensis]